MEVHVLTVSSKGQISLPINMRKMMSINAGDKLVAYASGDAIMLKPLKLPGVEGFEKSLADAEAWAATVGYKESDVADIIKDVRRKKRKDSN